MAARAALSQDVAHRIAAAKVATSALSRPVLGRAGVSIKAKVAVAKACVHGRCTYLAGLWAFIPAGTMERLSAAMMRPFRIIVGAHKPPVAGPHMSNSAVLEKVKQPPPAWIILLSRIRTALALSVRAPPYALALVQGQGGSEWRFALPLSMKALRLVMAPKLDDLPDPVLDPTVWEHSWKAAPAAWGALLRAARCKAGQDPARAEQILQEVPELNTAEDLAVDSDPDEFMCGQCTEVFSTAAGATLHRLKSHPELPNWPLLTRQSVAGSSCPVCNIDFNQRLRVLHHLRRRGGVDSDCRRRVLDGEFAGNSPETVAAADAVDAAHRRCCRAAGRHVLAGPTCALAAP